MKTDAFSVQTLPVTKIILAAQVILSFIIPIPLYNWNPHFVELVSILNLMVDELVIQRIDEGEH